MTDFPNKAETVTASDSSRGVEPRCLLSLFLFLLSAMPTPKTRAFLFAKKTLLDLRPGLEGVAEDPDAATEWVTIFSNTLVQII